MKGLLAAGSNKKECNSYNRCFNWPQAKSNQRMRPFVLSLFRSGKIGRRTSFRGWLCPSKEGRGSWGSSHSGQPVGVQRLGSPGRGGRAVLDAEAGDEKETRETKTIAGPG